MAAKSLAKSTVNWQKIATNLMPEQQVKANKLKAICDAAEVKMTNLPGALPAIDWSWYKAHASNPKLVEELEKTYSSIKITRPKAPASRLNELKVAQEEDEKRFEKFKTLAKSYIESVTVVKGKFEKMIPVKDMNMEEWTRTFPDWSVTKERPSVYPHYGRAIGLTREEAAAFDMPEPTPFATKTAWKDWETKYKKHYE